MEAGRVYDCVTGERALFFCRLDRSLHSSSTLILDAGTFLCKSKFLLLILFWSGNL
jgi:hypothetical protein